MIEGVYEALDHENEYYFDDKAKKLYVIPNTTSTSTTTARQHRHPQRNTPASCNTKNNHAREDRFHNRIPYRFSR